MVMAQAEGGVAQMMMPWHPLWQGAGWCVCVTVYPSVSLWRMVRWFWGGRACSPFSVISGMVAGECVGLRVVL